MTDREAFDQYCVGWFDDETEARLAWLVWQVATTAERERCVKACDAIAEDKWALYKGRPPYTGKEPGRASDYVQGQSDGADQCADAIRKGTE